MTRNRNRKDQARQLQRETGARRAAASRAHDALKQRAQPVQGMLAGAAGAVASAGPADAAAFLPAAWQAVCVIGAAAELLAECAGTRDYRGRFHLASEPLGDAVNAMRAMRATPALRSAPCEVNPAGSPADQLSESDAEEIRAAIVTTCDVLAAAASQLPSGIRPPSAARACRAAGRSARLISGIYQPPSVPPADDGGAAAARPCYLDAGTPAEMGAAIGAHLRELLTVDPADITGAMVAAWYGFSLAFTLGQFLASRSPDLAVLHENAVPAWASVIDAMDAAPSLPAGVHGLGLDTVPDADPALMVLAHQGVLDLILALNSLLPQVSEHARQRRRPRRGHEVHGPVRRAGRLLHGPAQDVPEPAGPTTRSQVGRHPHPAQARQRPAPSREKHLPLTLIANLGRCVRDRRCRVPSVHACPVACVAPRTSPPEQVRFE